MSVFNVVGVVKYGNMVLQASTVKFEKDSKLVLSALREEHVSSEVTNDNSRQNRSC